MEYFIDEKSIVQKWTENALEYYAVNHWRIVSCRRRWCHVGVHYTSFYVAILSWFKWWVV